MDIKKILCPVCDENCYLLYRGNTGILIDPGSGVEKILESCRDIDIPYIILTHCHFDHISSAEAIKKEKQSRIIATAECSLNLSSAEKNVSVYFGAPLKIGSADIILSDGETLSTSIGDIKCIKTPGHTECSACFLIDKALFSGDTLFKLTVGRVDLPTGNAEKIKSSVREKLYVLDDDILVYPGHGEVTTIGYEKKHNLFIKAE